ncbi:MAG: serine/threonine-protein kinase PknK [Leptospiraceae bacterium]|nr:serine/threonine-protein kinase PknK [Leptospiraceae bacterium]
MQSSNYITSFSPTGYESLIRIYEGSSSLVFRAKRSNDGYPVILKLLKNKYPTPEQLRMHRQEFHLVSQLNQPNIIKAYKQETWKKIPYIVFEDFGGISVKEWLESYTFDFTIEIFLKIALKIVHALEQLHSQNIIHKDINPSNIVINPNTLELKIIDLGISSSLSQEVPGLQAPGNLEGTLYYISPEQTGRMNRIVDYRTDFYSLGVTFYEIITGQIPFKSTDPMELVHSHIAKYPVPPHNLEVNNRLKNSITPNSNIPEVISNIILKLMAKNAEDRYQSTWGLKIDLEECEERWLLNKSISLFPPGRKDFSDRLQIPQKLYGRDVRIASLLSAFDSVANENLNRNPIQAVLITGESGIGKSALVRSLYKPITEKRGYFIEGKFDQFQTNLPFSALINAFTGLVQQLLGEPEQILKEWRTRLNEALGNNGQVITDVIQSVEMIIGPQKPVPKLGMNENQNRFNHCFKVFTQSFCSSKHPLVIFLDDMQWADSSTLNFLTHLLSENPKYLLIILAYRKDKVSDGHPLSLVIEQLKQKGTKFEQIQLLPLNESAICELVSDTLNLSTSTIQELAKLIIKKTGGNPFFTSQFIKTLYKEQLLTFNHLIGLWDWNLANIENMGFTDNVIELMEGELKKLPFYLQELLSIAAYLGNQFNLKSLSLIQNKPEIEIFNNLNIPLQQGYIIGKSQMNENLLIQDYQFTHDRIQQAAYSLIPSDKSAEIHYRIGNLLKEQLKEEDLENRIFEVVDHLNNGRSLLRNSKEVESLVKLNLLAGKKARETNAYQIGRKFIEIGISLLGEDLWSRHYSISLELHELSAELASLCGDFEEVEKTSKLLIDNSKSVLEKVSVYRTRILSKIYQHELNSAIEIALDILNELNVFFRNYSGIFGTKGL